MDKNLRYLIDKFNLINPELDESRIRKYIEREKVLLINAAKDIDSASSIDYILAKDFGRSANQIQQIQNSHAIAKKMGVKYIILEIACSLISCRRIELDGVTLINGLDLSFANDKLIGVSGYFFNTNDDLGFPWISHRVAFSKLLSPFLDQRLFALESLNERDLVIHIRSGDIFLGAGHSGYGQPPLAYYIFCIKKFNELIGLNSVVLVFENYNNPIIALLIDWLSLNSYSYTIKSSDFMSDLSVLFSAENLIIGRGTFGNLMAYHSSNLKRLYYFQDHSRYASIAEHRGFCSFKVIDFVGVYNDSVLKFFNNSPEQVQLMKSYPLSSLSFLDDSSLTA